MKPLVTVHLMILYENPLVTAHLMILYETPWSQLILWSCMKPLGHSSSSKAGVPQWKST